MVKIMKINDCYYDIGTFFSHFLNMYNFLKGRRMTAEKTAKREEELE